MEFSIDREEDFFKKIEKSLTYQTWGAKTITTSTRGKISTFPVRDPLPGPSPNSCLATRKIKILNRSIIIFLGCTTISAQGVTHASYTTVFGYQHLQNIHSGIPVR